MLMTHLIWLTLETPSSYVCVSDVAHLTWNELQSANKLCAVRIALSASQARPLGLSYICATSLSTGTYIERAMNLMQSILYERRGCDLVSDDTN
jgi:hypothetical protein